MKSSRGITNSWPLSLQEAIKSKNYIHLQKYLEAGLNFNTRETTDGFTPLQTALHTNDIKMVRFLLEHKADPNQDFLPNDQWSYISPLYFALAKRSSAMAILLIEYGANIFAMSYNKTPLICLAVRNDRVQVIQYLMKNGISPDTLINDELSLLTFAAEEMKTGVVKCILKYKPNVNLHQHKRVIAAAIHGYLSDSERLVNKRMVSMLYKYGFTLNRADINCKLIVNSIREGHCHVIQNLLKLDVSPNFETLSEIIQSRAETMLHTAVKSKSPEIVQLLLEAGANVHIRDVNGKTPILHAAYMNNLRIIKLLLKYGAAVTDVDSSNHTVLHFAIMEIGCYIPYLDWCSNRIKSKILELFISNGADVNVKTSDGCSPLHYAALLGMPSVVQVLLAHGARVDELNYLKKTPLEIALQLPIVQRNTDDDPEVHLPETFIELKAATFQLLHHHVHRLHRSGLPVYPRDLAINHSAFQLSDNVNKIIDSEIQFIKETNIGDSSITLHRFLMSTEKEAAGFVRNDVIFNNLKTMLNHKNKFHGYADLIRNKLTIALRKKELDRGIFKLINFFFEEKKLPSLPDICTRYIISFLTDEDKKVAIDQFTR